MLARKERKQYSYDEKLALAELCCKIKEEYDVEVKHNGGKSKTKHVSKRKRYQPIVNTQGFVAKAVRQFYSDLAK